MPFDAGTSILHTLPVSCSTTTLVLRLAHIFFLLVFFSLLVPFLSSKLSVRIYGQVKYYHDSIQNAPSVNIFWKYTFRWFVVFSLDNSITYTTNQLFVEASKWSDFALCWCECVHFFSFFRVISSCRSILIFMYRRKSKSQHQFYRTFRCSLIPDKNVHRSFAYFFLLLYSIIFVSFCNRLHAVHISTISSAREESSIITNLHFSQMCQRTSVFVHLNRMTCQHYWSSGQSFLFTFIRCLALSLFLLCTRFSFASYIINLLTLSTSPSQVLVARL